MAMLERNTPCTTTPRSRSALTANFAIVSARPQASKVAARPKPISAKLAEVSRRVLATLMNSSVGSVTLNTSRLPTSMKASLIRPMRRSQAPRPRITKIGPVTASENSTVARKSENMVRHDLPGAGRASMAQACAAPATAARLRRPQAPQWIEPWHGLLRHPAGCTILRGHGFLVQVDRQCRLRDERHGTFSFAVRFNKEQGSGPAPIERAMAGGAPAWSA